MPIDGGPQPEKCQRVCLWSYAGVKAWTHRGQRRKTRFWLLTESTRLMELRTKREAGFFGREKRLNSWCNQQEPLIPPPLLFDHLLFISPKQPGKASVRLRRGFRERFVSGFLSCCRVTGWCSVRSAVAEEERWEQRGLGKLLILIWSYSVRNLSKQCESTVKAHPRSSSRRASHVRRLQSLGSDSPAADTTIPFKVLDSNVYDHLFYFPLFIFCADLWIKWVSTQLLWICFHLEWFWFYQKFHPTNKSNQFLMASAFFIHSKLFSLCLQNFLSLLSKQYK